MADEADDWDEGEFSGEDSEIPETRPVAKVPERRSDRKHAGMLRRQIGIDGLKRRNTEAYLEVHEVKPASAATPTESVWDGDPVAADDVWDEDPATEDQSELSAEERKKRVLAKRKRDAEIAWGQRQRRMNLWWTLAGGVTLVVLGIFLGRADRRSMPAAVIEEPSRFESSIELSETAVAGLLTVGREALPKLTEMLEVAQGEPAAAAPVVAGGVHTAALMPDWRERVGPVSEIKEDGVLGMLASVLGEDAYLVVTGLRNDYSRYVAYFVESEGDLRLDWRATVGYSEMLPGEVPDLAAGESKLMRVVASPSSFYTLTYPDNEYACFLISHLDRERYAWAYVQRESPVHQRLLGALGAPLTRPTAGRLTLVVRRGAAESMPNQVLIQDVVGADWLSVRDGNP